MKTPRTCRICGCTDDRACTDGQGGRCHWVEDDLCSACIPDLVLTEGDVDALATAPDIHLGLPSAIAFQLLSILQLALRHPKLPPQMTQTALALGGLLEEKLTLTPNLAAIIHYGWPADAPEASGPPKKARARLILPGDADYGA